MKNLKSKIVLLCFAVITSVILYSCENEEPINQENRISLNESDFDLKLVSFDSFGKEFDLPENDIKVFFKKHFDELLTLDENLEINILSKKGKKTFVIKPINDTKKSAKQNFARYETETICKTCTNESCVSKQLTAAIGEGDIDVNITVRVQRFMGVQTGLKVCYDRIPE
jgi:hypothetical protein